MNIFHKHKWVKIKETYAPPRETAEFTGGSPDFAQRITFGLTTLLWECEDCKKIRKEEMLGSSVQR